MLIASLMLFLDLCFEILEDPFPCSREKALAFRGSQRSCGVYLTVELDCGSSGAAAVSSLNGGNLSIGLVIDCELDAFVGVCNSDGRIEERRPAPVTMVVVMSQNAVLCRLFEGLERPYQKHL